jgi:hypothetical protein
LNARSTCPICSGKRVIPETSLAALEVAVAAEWHPTKNGALQADQVRPRSGKRVWWRCQFNRRHEWEAVIAQRTSRGQGCPHCYREGIEKQRKQRKKLNRRQSIAAWAARGLAAAR